MHQTRTRQPPTAAASAADPTTRVVLVGVHGHGRSHLANLERLSGRDTAPGVRLRLAGVCDPRPPGAELLGAHAGVHVGDHLEAVLDVVRPLVTIICTPIHTHADLTLRALAAGSHVLLEKPPGASLADLARLVEATSAGDGRVQIGFQSLGSAAIDHVRGLVADGAVGDPTLISAACAWSRSQSYYARAAWAGRRRLEGVDVVDGVLTNPLAHAVATALRLDGSDGSEPAREIEAELYRANDIEADDTSVVRMRTARGTRIVVAATLCAEVSRDPVIVVHGTRGSIEYAYKRGVVRLLRPGHLTAPELSWTLPTVDLLENLVLHALDPRTPLLVPPAATRSFMDVLEAVRTAPDPTVIDAAHVEVKVEDGVRRVVLPGIEEVLEEAAGTASLFGELGVPWATRARPAPVTFAPAALTRPGPTTAGPGVLTHLHVQGTEVATYLDGRGLEPVLAPRPFLHPVRTLDGIEVTDERPPDHPWHLGVGVAVQDVSGNNLWGGRTYVRGEGYTWRPDHGRMRHERFRERSPGGFVQDVAWQAADGADLVRERREVAAAAIAPQDESAQGSGEAVRAWMLTWCTTLTAVGPAPVVLGSPATNGRDGGGYGGFFWRLPPLDEMTITTPTASGEVAANGSRAPWLAIHGRAGTARFTLVAAGLDDATRGDAWFVRSAGYPGFGSSLAAEAPVVLHPGEDTSRRFAVVVCDGHRDPASLARRATAGA